MAAVLAVMTCATSALAQGWTFDARKIALGNAGGVNHPSSRLTGEARYRAIVLPFGLVQVLRDWEIFNPDSDRFDLVRSIEYASSPLHYEIGRDDGPGSNTGSQFVLDLRNGELSRDLNAYRGFVPARQPVAEGLSHASFGGTIPLHRGSGGAFHGIFVGGGPYLSMRTAADIDQNLIDVLASDVDVYRPNAQFVVGVGNRAQLAAAITAGYRGRFGLAQAGSERDGVHVAVDFSYLLGFRYEDIDTNLRLDTDAAGLLTVVPGTTSLAIGRNHSTQGRGFALDVGVDVVSGILETGLDVKGIANRIDWTDVERTTYTLSTLFEGDGDFLEGVPAPVGDVRTELPQDYRGYIGARLGETFVVGELRHGFQGTSFRGGLEQGLGAIDVRGGAMYTREKWQPTGGVGFNFNDRVALDVAAYGTSANVQRERRVAIAASIRIGMAEAP
jgi:hypothetical protein